MDIPPQFENAAFDDFGDHPDIVKAARAWLRGGERFFTVEGPNGVGKTRLAYAMRTAAEGGSVAIPFIERCGQLAAALAIMRFGDADTRNQLYSVKHSRQPCILDDFGAGGPNKRTWPMLVSIIEHREHWSLPTAIFTNLTLQQLVEVDSRLASRMAGHLWLKMDGPDRRGEQ